MEGEWRLEVLGSEHGRKKFMEKSGNGNQEMKKAQKALKRLGERNPGDCSEAFLLVYFDSVSFVLLWLIELDCAVVYLVSTSRTESHGAIDRHYLV